MFRNSTMQMKCQHSTVRLHLPYKKQSTVMLHSNLCNASWLHHSKSQKAKMPAG